MAIRIANYFSHLDSQVRLSCIFGLVSKEASEEEIQNGYDQFWLNELMID